MSSLLNRFKSSAGTSASRATSSKKDPNAPQPTPLERLVADAGPLRQDGSDKLWGMENFGSTCYCNSIIQCLYHSPPFREHVLNFPFRATHPRGPNDVALPGAGSSENNVNLLTASGGKTKGMAAPTSPGGAGKAPATKTPGVTSSPQTPSKEDSKDSSEYKKKLALANGPLITLDTASGQRYGMADESLFCSLKDIFESVSAHDSRTGVVSPTKFLDILRRDHDVFRAPMHQDAHEFLNLLLNQIVENVEQYAREVEMKSPKAPAAVAVEYSDESEKSDSSSTGSTSSDSGILVPHTKPQTTSTLAKASKPNTRWVHELFEGTLTSETRCLTCENTSSRDEAFLDLSVDLDTYSSVTSCLLRFSEEEMLHERNKFHCDKCGGLQEAEKRMKIKKLPKILALHLKRFKYTEDLQRLQKLFHQVSYPYFLRLLNTTDDATESDRLYELYAVVVHIGGGPYHGHYVSIIKTQDRGWLLFDDENVEPVDRSFVWEFFGGEQSLACAYVLFYQETTVEAMAREQQEVVGGANHAEGAAHVNGKTATTNGGPLATGVLPTTPLMEDVESLHPLDRPLTAPLTASPATGILSRKENLPAATSAPRRSDDRERADTALPSFTTTTHIADNMPADGNALTTPPIIGLGLGEDLVAAPTHLSAPPPLLHQQHQSQHQHTGSGGSGFFNNSIQRFRQTSKSIKKQKLWGSGKFTRPDAQAGGRDEMQHSLESHELLAPPPALYEVEHGEGGERGLASPFGGSGVSEEGEPARGGRVPEAESAAASSATTVTTTTTAASAALNGALSDAPPPPHEAPSSSATESNRSSGRRLSLTSSTLLNSSVFGGGGGGPRTPSPGKTPDASLLEVGTSPGVSGSGKRREGRRNMWGFKRKSNNGSLGV